MFLASVRKYGHEPIILTEGYGGLGTKARMLKRAIDSGLVPVDELIFCDAFDVLFQSDPALAIARAQLDFKDKLVFNAEKQYWPPDSNLGERHPETGTPYRYLNSGFAVGRTELFHEMLKAMNADDIPNDSQRPDGGWECPNDQPMIQQLYVNQTVPIALDSTAQICQTIWGVEENELNFMEPKIMNTVMRTEPVAFHINGGNKEKWIPLLLKKLQLT